MMLKQPFPSMEKTVEQRISEIINQVKLLSPILDEFSDQEILYLSVLELRQILLRERRKRKRDNF